MRPLGRRGSGLYFSVIGLHTVWGEQVEEMAQDRAREIGRAFQQSQPICKTQFKFPLLQKAFTSTLSHSNLASSESS